MDKEREERRKAFFRQQEKKLRHKQLLLKRREKKEEISKKKALEERKMQREKNEVKQEAEREKRKLQQLQKEHEVGIIKFSVPISYKLERLPYSRKIWRSIIIITTAKFKIAKISYSHIYYYTNIMVIPCRTAKFKSANILAIAILGSTSKFNYHQYFWLYGIIYLAWDRCSLPKCNFRKCFVERAS